jgi:hypothetical protein
MMWVRPVVLGVLVGAVVARSAVAQPAPAPDELAFAVPAGAVEWQAPAECGDGSALRARIGKYVDHAIPSRRLALVVVERDGDAYRAEVRILLRGGEVAARTVQAPDCTAVVDAVALVVGMAAESAPPPAPPAPPPAPRPALAAAASPEAPAARHLALRARTAGDAGAMPGGGLGVDAGVVVATGRLAGVASFDVFPRRFAAAPGTTDVGADIGLVGGSVEGCVRAGPPWLCAGGAMARMSGRGIGVVGSHSASRIWSAVQVGVAADLPLRHGLRLTGEVDGLVALTRPRFVLDDGTLLYQPAAVGVRVLAGLEVRIF